MKRFQVGRSLAFAVVAAGSLVSSPASATVAPEIEYAAFNFNSYQITPWFKTKSEACEYLDDGRLRDYFYNPAYTKCSFTTLTPPLLTIEDYQPIGSRYVCPNGLLVNGDACVCKTGYVEIDGRCSCPPNSHDVNGTCQCDPNTVRVNGECTPCPAHMIVVDGTCRCDAANGYVDQGGTCVCGPNAYDAGGRCQCNPNAIFDGAQCVQCPANSTNVNDVCVCNTGYVSQGNECVCGANATDFGGTCRCNANYIDRGSGCEPCGAHASGDGTFCACDTGYAPDPVTGECVLECTNERCATTCGDATVSANASHELLSSSFLLHYHHPSLTPGTSGASISVDASADAGPAASCAGNCSTSAQGRATVTASALGMVAGGETSMTTTTRFGTKCDEESCSTVCDGEKSCRESSWSGALSGQGRHVGNVSSGIILSSGISVGVHCSYTADYRVVGEASGRRIAGAGLADCTDCEEQNVTLGTDGSNETTTSTCAATITVGRPNNALDYNDWLSGRQIAVVGGRRTPSTGMGGSAELVKTCTNCGTSSHRMFVQMRDTSGSCGEDQCIRGGLAEDFTVSFAPSCTDIHGRGVGYGLDVRYKNDCRTIDECGGPVICEASTTFETVITTCL